MSVREAGPRVGSGPRHTSILLVDDDYALCAFMREFFARDGMRLEFEPDGRDGLRRALDGAHDLVLLEVMLPGLDGFEVLRQVRRRSEVPVILLTARAGPADRVLGLDAGADDYVTKPFEPEELLARVRAVLRRAGSARRPGSEALEAGPLRVEPGTREAWCEGRQVGLTSLEFDALEHLVREHGRIVSRDELMGVLHQRRATPYDRSLDMHISHIRKKLGHRGGLIRTIRGVGYLYSADPGRSGCA
jgi:two-component system response regulator CpxR